MMDYILYQGVQNIFHPNVYIEHIQIVCIEKHFAFVFTYNDSLKQASHFISLSITQL